MHPPPDPVVDAILARNEQWAAGVSRLHPDSFHHLAKGQQPKVRSRRNALAESSSQS